MIHRAIANFVAVALALAGLAGITHAQQPTAFIGGTLIDGTGRAPVNDAIVVIRDGRIVCAGSRASCTVPAGAAMIDARNRWIMPGIVDAHVHYSQTGWADGRPDALNMMDRFPYIETVTALKDPTPFYRANLCSGVTATFDVGGYPWTWSLREPSDD
ncbi:MAG: amidohydrolase family protein, partial [Longimicrobiales bacterium]